MKLNARTLLIYLNCIKYEGNCKKTLKHFEKRIPLSDEEQTTMDKQVKDYVDKSEWDSIIAITDENYPEPLKRRPFPPFVVFKKNNSYACYDGLKNNELSFLNI